ncbi:hypothetical protein, partial [Enterococcus faecium]|uniref:hypothetical protein n=1 Tax=Enterococcus faecium TaxID=1352 RepID=UPI003AAB4C79
TSETRVTVWFSDGAVCSRIKGDKRNCMMVRYANGKVETFDKWKGTKYPPEVVKVLGNPPEDEAHGEISFAEQCEPLYMVMLTNTALPKSISELINIDDLD